MEFNNWKSFLSKSIMAPLLVIGILLYQEFLLVVNENLEPLVFGGVIFAYGLFLIVCKLFHKDKYNYLLTYGLIYSLVGSISIFFFSLLKNNLNIFIYVMSILYLMHAFFKVFIKTLNSKAIRVFDIIIGALWIVLVVFSVYSLKVNNESIKEIVNYAGFAVSLIEIILSIVRVIVYYIENAQIIKEIRITERATPKDAKKEISRNNSNNKKRKIREGKVEVIDLERFFKE